MCNRAVEFAEKKPIRCGIHAAKKVNSDCHSISLTTEAPWATCTLVDNLEYKGDMFNEPHTLQAPHSLT